MMEHFCFRLKVVISLLKTGEVALESIPQLATQWCAVHSKGYHALRNHTSSTQKPGEDEDETKPVMGALQIISITTSTITIVFSVIRFIARNPHVRWIFPGSPPAASLLPLSCLTLSSVLSGTVSFRLFIFYMGEPLANVVYSAVLVNSVSMLFTILTIIISHRIPIWNSKIF